MAIGLERERERALTFNQPVERKRAWKILAGLDFLLEVNMSFSSNNVFGYQESLRKIVKVSVNNFFLIFKTEKKNSIKIKIKKLDVFIYLFLIKL